MIFCLRLVCVMQCNDTTCCQVARSEDLQWRTLEAGLARVKSGKVCSEVCSHSGKCRDLPGASALQVTASADAHTERERERSVAYHEERESIFFWVYHSQFSAS